MKYKIVKTRKRGFVVKYSCPNCQDPLESPLLEGGQRDICPTCKSPFVVPGAKERAELEKQIGAIKERKAKEQALRENAERIQPPPLPSKVSGNGWLSSEELLVFLNSNPKLSVTAFIPDRQGTLIEGVPLSKHVQHLRSLPAEEPVFDASGYFVASHAEIKSGEILIFFLDRIYFYTDRHRDRLARYAGTPVGDAMLAAIRRFNAVVEVGALTPHKVRDAMIELLTAAAPIRSDPIAYAFVGDGIRRLKAAIDIWESNPGYHGYESDFRSAIAGDAIFGRGGAAIGLWLGDMLRNRATERNLDLYEEKMRVVDSELVFGSRILQLAEMTLGRQDTSISNL